MKYVDAGYCIALAVLFLYTVSLVVRRRRVERAAALVEPSRSGGGPEPMDGSSSSGAQ